MPVKLLGHMNETKVCSKCKQAVPLEKFAKRTNGLAYWCNPCNALHSREYRKKNKVRVAEIQKRSKEKYKSKTSQHAKEYQKRLREKVFAVFGNKCACCGETNKEFLCLDHKLGGGCQEAKKLGTRGVFVRVLREGFPREKYQILCHNCNMSLGFYGYCPHHPEIKRPLLSRNRHKIDEMPCELPSHLQVKLKKQSKHEKSLGISTPMTPWVKNTTPQSDTSDAPS